MLSHYVECDCHSPEHTLRMSADEDCVYLHVFLGDEPWHRRLLNAVLYVFGRKCNYGHFDEFVISRDKLDRLIKTLEGLRREMP
jgi:hypothetical protein